MNNILMNAQMALATQQGRKTQTRREINIPKDFNVDNIETTWAKDGGILDIRFDDYDRDEAVFIKPPYKIGQVLWVREPAIVLGDITEEEVLWFKYKSDEVEDCVGIHERFLQNDDYPKWMEKGRGIPNGCIKEMARTFIRVTNIRVERLNEISEEDCLKEMSYPINEYGENEFGEFPVEVFKNLWESINGKGSFDDRWVWVLEFEVISK